MIKSILRYFLINLIALWAASEIIKGLTFIGGIETLLLGALVFTAINIILVPLIKLLFLPINLLTLGLFSWSTNVLALFALTSFVPKFKLSPFYFPGYEFLGFSIPSYYLSTLLVAIVASAIIGIITHFLHWLMH